MTPYVAVSLALEGIITSDHLTQVDADHTDDQGRYIDIPNVTIVGILVTVRVRDNEDRRVIWMLDRNAVPIP